MLHRISDFTKLPASCQDAVVSIGNFDGLHLGHARLMERTVALARDHGVPAVALTFDPHPSQLLRPEIDFAPLMWLERKSELLQQHGIDEVVVIETSLEFLEQSSGDFFDCVVLGSLQPRGLIEGPNFRFGKNRTGSVSMLGDLCAAHGLTLEVVDPVSVDGQVVSSSRVRHNLSEGKVDLARQLLGRPHRLRGTVGAGAGRGAGIGFPTANLQKWYTIVPADGVYAGRAAVAGVTYPVGLNIGPNPTFQESRRKVEAHLVGFSGDLLGQLLEVDLLELVRATRRFRSSDELVDQIEADLQRVRHIASEQA